MFTMTKGNASTIPYSDVTIVVSKIRLSPISTSNQYARYKKSKLKKKSVVTCMYFPME